MEIYYRNSVFYLTDQIEFQENRKTIVLRSSVDLKNLIKQGKKCEINVYYHNLKMLKKNLFKIFRPIYAAGGVVKNHSNETLLIYRNEVWDLPKGKIEKNEFIEEAAIREVSEETGLKNVAIHSFIGESYHLYKNKGKNYLKVIFWYNMCTEREGDIKLTPQKKEGIMKAEWIREDDLGKTIKDSYPSIKNIFKTL